ncbi:MAG: hypothetical protein C0599_06205 [Salinivirgaceae bacterium]|nr:MAG: hypothetical protein C0599_06205 [Salinivirgaceae bacterium]
MLKVRNSLLLIALVALVVSACSEPEKKAQTQNVEQKVEYKAEKVWSTDHVFNVPESVCYDSDRDVLYIANIVGKPSEKDGEGFISRLSTKGEVLDLEWVAGLDAPKGMGVYGEKLYVTNVDELVEINITEGKENARYAIEGATFANDIAIDQHGNVFISGMQNGAVYKFDGQKVSEFLKQGTFNRPNGLFACKDKLYVGTSDRVYAVDYKTADTATYIKNTDPVDGLEKVANDVFLKSDWQGRVHLVRPGMDKFELTNTIADTVNAADIEYIKDQSLMLVPTFFDNRIVAYKISK